MLAADAAAVAGSRWRPWDWRLLLVEVLIEGWLLLMLRREWDRCLVMVVQVVVLGVLLLLLLVKGSLSVHQVFVEPFADVVAHLGRKLVGKMLLGLLLLVLLLLLMVVGPVERLLLVHELLLLALVVLAVVAEAALVMIRWLEGHLDRVGTVSDVVAG